MCHGLKSTLYNFIYFWKEHWTEEAKGTKDNASTEWYLSFVIPLSPDFTLAFCVSIEKQHFFKSAKHTEWLLT